MKEIKLIQKLENGEKVLINGKECQVEKSIGRYPCKNRFKDLENGSYIIDRNNVVIEVDDRYEIIELEIEIDIPKSCKKNHHIFENKCSKCENLPSLCSHNNNCFNCGKPFQECLINTNTKIVHFSPSQHKKEELTLILRDKGKYIMRNGEREELKISGQLFKGINKGYFYLPFSNGCILHSSEHPFDLIEEFKSDSDDKELEILREENEELKNQKLISELRKTNQMFDKKYQEMAAQIQMPLEKEAVLIERLKSLKPKNNPFKVKDKIKTYGIIEAVDILPNYLEQYWDFLNDSIFEVTEIKDDYLILFSKIIEHTYRAHYKQCELFYE